MRLYTESEKAMDLRCGSTREQLQYTYNLLQRFKGSVLVLDVRSRQEFESVRLAEALSLAALRETETPLSLETLQAVFKDKAEIQLFARRKRLCVIVCHSESSQLLATSVFQILQADKCKELHLLAAPIAQFLEIYTFLSSGRLAKPLKTARFGYPNEIIPDRLFLGNQHHAESPEVIAHLGITHIVNATKTVPNRFPERVQYCRIVVEDSHTEMICYHFNIAFRFMDYALLENGESAENRVLVHCAQGVSRSATIVIMYVMKKFDWSFQQAFDFVRRHRYEVQPNDGFQEQIREFEDARNRFRSAQQLRKQLLAAAGNGETVVRA